MLAAGAAEDAAGPVLSAETFFSEEQAVSDASDNVTAKNVAVVLRKLEFMNHFFLLQVTKPCQPQVYFKGRKARFFAMTAIGLSPATMAVDEQPNFLKTGLPPPLGSAGRLR